MSYRDDKLTRAQQKLADVISMLTQWQDRLTQANDPDHPLSVEDRRAVLVNANSLAKRALAQATGDPQDKGDRGVLPEVSALTEDACLSAELATIVGERNAEWGRELLSGDGTA